MGRARGGVHELQHGFPLDGQEERGEVGISRVFSFYPKGSKECSRSVVVPVWSRSLQVAVHAFAKYSDRVPHMTVQAHSASHRFHDINKVAACYSPNELEKKNLEQDFPSAAFKLRMGGERLREKMIVKM